MGTENNKETTNNGGFNNSNYGLIYSLLKEISDISVGLKLVAERLSKLEENESTLYKSNFELKDDILSAIKDAGSDSNILFANCEKNAKIIETANNELGDISKKIDELKSGIMSISEKVCCDDKCRNCLTLKQNEKTMSMLWKITGLLLLITLSVLGLNLFGVIKLPWLTNQ